jgi:hypothetical protein
MSDAYTQPLDVKRRPWQRRIEVFSPKLRRRLTLFSRETLDAWVLLEADRREQSFCERPAYVEGTAGRTFDTVEFDAHKLDVRLKILDQDPFGQEHALEIERVCYWL